MASSEAGRIKQRKGWVRWESLPKGRKVVDWWSINKDSQVFQHCFIGVATDDPDPLLSYQKIFCVNGVKQGPRDFERQGRRMTMKSIRWTGRMIPPENPSSYEAAFPRWARASIVYDKSPSWTQLADPSGLYQCRDSMQRWTKAWEMQNSHGIKISTPWGYGSNIDTSEEFLIIANELYELPPTYRRLDWGRNLQSSYSQHNHDVPEVKSTIEGTYPVPAIAVDGDPQTGIGYRCMAKSWMGIGDDEGTRIEGIIQPGTVTETGGDFGFKIGDMLTSGTPGVLVNSTQVIDGSITRTSDGTYTSTDSNFRFDGANRLDNDPPNITTTLEGGLIGGEDPDNPGSFLPVAEITEPAHSIIERESTSITTSLPDGEPTEPYNGTERTMPIPFCSTTGINFDIYRQVDLEVVYNAPRNELFDGEDPQQITWGAIYVTIHTDVFTGWRWEGYVRITYEDK